MPLVGADVLADDRADEGEAEADVQAGEDPRGGGRDDDLSVTLRSLAPRMRALSTRLRSTSRAPWKALKKTGKNTRTTAEATLEAMPRPNQMTKIGASTIRGYGVGAP